MANQVDNGRLVRTGKVIKLHDPWTLQDTGFVGAGIWGVGYQAYLFCHREGGVSAEIQLDDGSPRSKINLAQIAFVEWDEKSAESCIRLFHDVLEVLLPTGLLQLDSILDALEAEVYHRWENHLEPFRSQ